MKVISIDDLVTQDAKKYGVNYDHLYKTLDCESEGFKDVAIQSQVPDPAGPGGHEPSYGLAQIDLEYHPDISLASATDPVFAVDFAAKVFAYGNPAQMFSCYDIEKDRGWD